MASKSPDDLIEIDRSSTPVSLRTLAMPAATNADLAGGTYAFYVAQGRVATVAVTGMKFHKPVYVGDEVSCYCATQHIGNTSIAVQVETWVRRRREEVEEKVTEGLFTFVAIDKEGNPRPVDTPDNSYRIKP